MKTIRSSGGTDWTVDILEAPVPYARHYLGIQAKGFLSCGQAVGYIKRLAKNNGGTAAWVVAREGGRWHVYIIQ